MLHDLCHDAVVSMLGNLDIWTLFRLGKVSKHFQLIVKKKDGVLMRAVLLNSFPGITNVPYGMDYKYYHNALTLYYYPVKGLCYEPGIIIHKIGECLSRSAMTNEKLDQCMFYLCLIFGGLFFDAGGRRKILQCVKDWKVVISLYKTQFIVDAGAILDRISTFASSFFKFEQMPSVVRRQNYLNFGVISMEAESIPEVVRHTQRFTTTTTALLLWWYHLIQIEADIVFLFSPAASHNGSFVVVLCGLLLLLLGNSIYWAHCISKCFLSNKSVLVPVQQQHRLRACCDVLYNGSVGQNNIHSGTTCLLDWTKLVDAQGLLR